MSIETHAREIVHVPVEQLVPNPKNNNRHSVEQIDRLAKLIAFQGFRNPIIVSNRTGFMVAGHGRLDAAKKAGMATVPVVYQDFDSEAQEYAYLTSDNEIARWAELDFQAVYDELKAFPELDIDMLGIEKFSVDALDFEPGSEDDQGKLDQKKLVILECPSCLHHFEKGQAREIES